MFGSTFRQQVRNLERYAKKGYEPSTRVDVIISVMCGPPPPLPVLLNDTEMELSSSVDTAT